MAAPQRHMLQAYRVLSPSARTTVGPYLIVNQGDTRVVLLTPEQARFYIDQGVIAPM